MQFQCETCGKKFHDAKYLKQHMLTHDDRSVECPICQRISKSPRILGVHMSKQHGKQMTDMYECKTCGKKFENESNLFVHMRSGHTPERTLGVHMSKQHGEKMTDMYECKTCGKKFENESNLFVHMRFGHTPERTLGVHMSKQHGEKMTDMYECKTCGKKFENERNLSVHMRFGDTPHHTCRICGVEFDSQKLSYDHGCVHVDKTSYLCKKCRIHEIVYGSTDVGASSAIDGKGINMDDVNDKTPPLFGDDAIIDGLLAWEHTPPVLD